MQPPSVSTSDPASHSDSERAEESSSGNQALNNNSSANKDVKDVPGTTARDWTNEEQQKLDEAMAHYPAEKYSPAERCMHLAAQMPNRTARDVALRIKWLQQHPKYVHSKGKAAGGGANQGTTAAQGNQGAGRGAAEAAGRSAQAATSARGGKVVKDGPTTALSKPFDTGSAEGEKRSLGPMDPTLSPVNQLLSENYVVLKELQANMQACKVAENTELLMRFKDNLLSVLEKLGQVSTSGHLALMPQLPVHPNLELANRVFSNMPISASALPAARGGGGLSTRSSDASALQPCISPRFLTAGGNPLPDNFLPTRGNSSEAALPPSSSGQMSFLQDLHVPACLPDAALLGDLDLELGDLALFLPQDMVADMSGGSLGSKKQPAARKLKGKEGDRGSHQSTSMAYKSS